MGKKKLVYIISLPLLVICSIFAYYNFKKPPEVPQTAEDQYRRGHNIPGKLYWAGSAQDKEIALTFDDGPEEEWTPKVLDTLKQKNVRATFFIIGKQAQKYPKCYGKSMRMITSLVIILLTMLT